MLISVIITDRELVVILFIIIIVISDIRIQLMKVFKRYASERSRNFKIIIKELDIYRLIVRRLRKEDVIMFRRQSFAEMSF